MKFLKVNAAYLHNGSDDAISSLGFSLLNILLNLSSTSLQIPLANALG